MSFFRCASLAFACVVLLTSGYLGIANIEFQREKLALFFFRFDRDKDSRITKEDYDLVATDFSENAKLDKEKEKLVKEKKFPEFYGAFTLHKDDSGNSVSLEKLETSFDEQRDDPKLKQMIRNWLVAAFKIVDLDNDGVLDLDEYIIGAGSICGLTAAEASIIFAVVDVDGSKNLTVEECFQALVEYFLGVDEKTPLRYLFGRPEL